MSPIDRIDRAVTRVLPAGFYDRYGDQVDTNFMAALGVLPDRARAIQALRGRRWLGHPVHPLLTDLVTGAWSIAWLLDLLEMTGMKRFRAGADAAVLIGLAAVPPTALSGVADWQQLSGAPRRVGLLHANVNGLAAACYAVSSVQRARGRRGAGRLWGHAGFALVTLAAYLGGELVFNAGSSVHPDAGRASSMPRPPEAEALADDESIGSPVA